jgi:hypothetical protein
LGVKKTKGENWTFALLHFALLCSTLLSSMLEGDYSPSDSGDEEPSAAPHVDLDKVVEAINEELSCSLQREVPTRQLHQIQREKVYAA